MLILGIDPGLKGGLAFLEEDKIAAVFTMPLMEGPRGKPVVHAWMVVQLLTTRGGRKPDLAVLENVHAIRGDAVVSAFSFGYSTGKLAAALEIKEVPVETPAPQQWMKEILAHRTHDKPGYLAYVQQRFPEVDLFPGGKKKKEAPHDGIAAAVCLAEYGRRLLLGKKARDGQ